MNTYNSILKLHARGMHNQSIADTLGTTSQYVSYVIKQEGLRRNDKPVRDELWWQREAKKRGVTATELKQKLLSIIRQDDLIDAILDEEKGNVGKNKAGHSRPAECTGTV